MHKSTQNNGYYAKLQKIYFLSRYILNYHNFNQMVGNKAAIFITHRLSCVSAADRIIVIEFENRRQLEKCFASAEYATVKGLRENSVKTNAVIVEQ